MNDWQLQKWVEQISLSSFGLPFRHRARFNSRLRATGGRYFLHTHDIEISRLHFEVLGAEETENIIKHELCHYHLHLAGKGYRHSDPEFKQLLARVGGSRHCRAVIVRKEEKIKYELLCLKCGMRYKRKRKVNTNHYVCGRCLGKLRQIPLI